ncbi:MAG: NAD(P)-binding domain-containing protein [Methylotenera sp.]|nr:NAD(P)-binding domain-containing protein [Methylotenera sp.]MDD4927428.1 NAD(P)-binding domain-containing protein [Methylotenera sp.]NOS95272.1 NAD(P)-binding domain-containing protein [Methylotenera sp.]NOU41817.1 NAD(P)-binding domain-containing protein [Methylotenera sp.]
MSNQTLLIYLIPLLLVMSLYIKHNRQLNRRGKARLHEARESGLTEPASIHPVIDPTRCCGSGACVKACPEKALSLVNGKAVLTDPTHCIGHGACLEACPVEAIQLVFGTEKRGMDIPFVSPTFETNVNNIFIAGELGGMGLIRKAAVQGKQAIDSIVKKINPQNDLDVVIVGAGPAGLSASLAAKEKGLKFVTLEQEESLGGAIFKYPRNKVAMTQPVNLPIVGLVEMYDISKEELLGFWLRIVNEQALPIKFKERMETIRKTEHGYEVKTANSTYKASNILLAIGRQGTPRKLNVPGENLAKVIYRLVDPEQFKGQHVLVVGGGDSAIEAAITISEQSGTTVTLSYRSESFGRIKPKNREKLELAVKNNQLRVELQSNVKEILQDTASIELASKETVEIPNEAVIICAGGVLPTPMLKEIGVMVETHYGTKPAIAS